MPSVRATHKLAWALVLAVFSATLAGVAAATPTWLLPPTVLSLDADQPDVAVSSSGEAAVVFLADVGGKALVHATVRPSGGTWSAPVPVSDPAYDANSPQVVLDDAGNATAVWTSLQGSGSSPIRTASRPTSPGQW